MITAYIITDLNNQLSRILTEQTQQCLDHFGWSYKIWPAVNGFALTDQHWQRLGIRLLSLGKTAERPGAQGCIHSHFTLWQHCVELAEPIVVLEHDALAQAEFPSDLNLDHCVWRLWSADVTRQNSVSGTWSRGSWAYTLTPSQAQQLIDFSRQQGVQALDKQLGSRAVQWQSLGWDLFKHNPRPRLSQTASRLYPG